ncbi:hypothetical protein T439DRAFT_329112 [Meredithblackwellia eburnea MCA 4105]
MLNAIGLSQPTLRIMCEEEIVYLHPTPESQGPSEDPLLLGTVTLDLPKPRVLKHLTVALVGHQSIGFPSGGVAYEETISLSQKVSLVPETSDGGGDLLLEKGQHSFKFRLLVPSSTPSHERCQHGRVRHSIVAKAKGLGPFGGDVVSKEIPIFLIPNPGGAGPSIPPPAVNYRFQSDEPDLGNSKISLKSQHIMVGGLLLLRLSIVSPPNPVNIHSIRISINQTFTLTSAVNPERIVTIPTEQRHVLLLDHSHPANEGRLSPSEPPPRAIVPNNNHLLPPMKVLRGKGDKLRLRHLGRLPIGESVRPTTLPGSGSGIKVEHEILFEVVYSLVGESTTGEGLEEGCRTPAERRKFGFRTPLDIYSCCCLPDSLSLPPYSADNPNPEDELMERAPPCLCELPFESVLKEHWRDLVTDEDIEDLDEEEDFGGAGEERNVRWVERRTRAKVLDEERSRSQSRERRPGLFGRRTDTR